ncbi:14083_t:CDS:2, partial [Funneliformis geosporum]
MEDVQQKFSDLAEDDFEEEEKIVKATEILGGTVERINLNNNEMAFDEEIVIEDDEQSLPNNATRKIRINEP